MDLPAFAPVSESPMPEAPTPTQEADAMSVGVDEFDSSMEQTPQTTDLELEEETTPKSKASRAPTFQNFLKASTGTKEKPVFSETIDPAISAAMPTSDIISSKFQGLGKLTPQDRAARGVKLGGLIGMGVGGPVGAIVGANVGSLMGRTVGNYQSGEQEDISRRENIGKNLKDMKIADEENVIRFSDGGSFRMSVDPMERIPNITNNILTQKDRATYEVDNSNPFSKRASTAAKPLAYFITQGLMGFKDNKNERDINTYKSSLGYLTNALTAGVTSGTTVSTRAKELAKKIGVDKQKMLNYFDTLRPTLSKEEWEDINKGIDMLYG